MRDLFRSCFLMSEIRMNVSLVNRPWCILVLMLVSLLCGCASNPVTGKSELRLVSEQQEIQMGTSQYQPSQQSVGGLLTIDPELTAYVKEVGAKLVKVSARPNLPFEFNVVNDSVPNAWALPGGKIALNRGLLTELKSEAELAAVLGHEIVHAAARHSASAMEHQTLIAAGAAVLSAVVQDNPNHELISLATQGGAALYATRFSREHELEADHYGIDYMARAGYDPQAAVSLQETFVRLSGNKSPNWLEGLFASHPPSQERVEANRRMVSSYPDHLFMGEEVFQRKMALLTRTKPAYAAYDEGRKLLEKDPKQALEKAAKAIAIEPREALFQGLRADALKKLGRPAEAEKAYGEALSRNSGFYALHLNRGLLRQQQGDAAGATADLERANNLLPTAAAHAVLGKLAQNAGNTDKAIGHFKFAAASATDVGRGASQALARLDMPRNPGAYIQVEAVSDAAGNIGLRVTNQSAVAVKGIRVVASISRASAGDLLRKEYRVDGPLKPKQAVIVALGMRLAEVQVPLNRVSGQIRTADIAE